MTFDAPVVLALAPLIGGAVWFAAAWARRVRIRRAALWSQETVRQAVAAGRLGPTALAVAAFLGVVALAGPRWGEERIVAETRGLSVVIAVDISRSMLAEDATPSRLRRAVREARRLVQDLDGDRVGLIAFAGSSYILSPLSIDGSALTLYLDALDPDMASQGGTGLAPALRQGAELLQASSDLADRVLVVFTDGEAHDSVPPIVAQAHRLKAGGGRLSPVAASGRGRAAPRAGGGEAARGPPRARGGRGWARRALRRAGVAYLTELAARRKEDAAWYNAGTAALADSDAETAQASLAHAAASLDPDVRFRALYNLGLLALRQADDDSAGRDGHLADAERAYREALLLRPHDRPAKWNLELAVRHRGGSQNKAPPSGGGGSGPSGGGTRNAGGAEGGLSPTQAEQLLRSIGHEELRTRRDRTGLMRHPAEPGVKDW